MPDAPPTTTADPRESATRASLLVGCAERTRVEGSPRRAPISAGGFASDVVALDVSGEAFRELVGVEAELGDVISVRAELPLRVRVDGVRDRGAPDIVELVTTRRVDRRHRAGGIGHEIGVLHINDGSLGV